MCTGAAGIRTRQALYKRIVAWKSSLESPARETMKAIDIIRGRGGNKDNNPTAEENIFVVVEELVEQPVATRASYSTRAAVATALDNLPEWLDENKTQSAMIVRKKRSPPEVCRDNFMGNAIKDYYLQRFSAAFKEATTIVHSNMTDILKMGKRGFGVDAVSEDVNSRLLSSPNDRKIKPTALYNAVKEGRIGVSPLKRGRKAVIPEILPSALAAQAVMMQVAGVGEASAKKMKVLVEGLTSGTKWEDKINPDYTWRKTRTQHPAILNPVKAKKNEDRRVDWLSYNNIMTWTERAKDFLISIGMAKDEPGVIRKLPIVLSLLKSVDISLHNTNFLLCFGRWCGVIYFSNT